MSTRGRLTWPLLAGSLFAAGCQADVAAPVDDGLAFEVFQNPVNPPFYARVERPFTVHTDDWAAIVFYRPPSCVPAGFNLLDFFDIPGAFFCGPLAVEGWEMRKVPDPFAAPWQSEMHGLGAVPVWLVSWVELKTALIDGVLTVPELMGLASLQIGSAHTFSEMLQPIPTRLPSRLVMNAEGLLADGRRFRLHFNSEDTFTTIDVRSVRIDVW